MQRSCQGASHRDMTSVFDQGKPPACPAPFNLAAYVLQMTDALADKPAVSVLGRTTRTTWTFGELASAVRGTGTGLLALGLKPGDRVLMRLGNTVDFPVAYLGALAVGLVPVPTSPMLTKVEAGRIAQELDVKAVVQAPDVPAATASIVVTLESLRAMRTGRPCDWHFADPERLGYIVYTSGSSGAPRAVGHAHRAIWARRMMFEGWYGLTQSDRVLHAGAFNWTYTLGTGLMDPWTCGATALIPAPDLTATDLPMLLKTEEVTIFAAAPGVYRKILKDSPVLDLPDLRHGLAAGEKLSATISKAWKDATGTRLFEAFGMSECSTFISSSPSQTTTGDALGRPQRGRRVAILKGDVPVALNEPGTIAVHCDDPGLMLGYLNAADPFDGQRVGDWFKTGDLGAMDGEGQITYLGRADDVMNAGGYRVSPLEVEAVLSQMPGIEQIAVTEVEVKQDVRIIAAFYTAASPLHEPDLIAFARSHLARYKQPKAWVHLESLPTNANGKLQRKALRAIYEVPK